MDIFRLAGTPDQLIVRDCPITVGGGGEVKLTLTPVQGQALICGAVLEPVKLHEAAAGTFRVPERRDSTSLQLSEDGNAQ